MKTHRHAMANRAHRAKGVSLIELMVAITIASLLTLGLIQIFGASRASSQLQEGLSRVQENGRFATQFLQRQLRMVGFMGCGADTGRFTQDSFVNHFATFAGVLTDNTYRFQRPIEAYRAGATIAPELDDGLTFVPNSDVLILRVMSEESVPVVSIGKAGNILSAVVGTPDAAFLPAPGDATVFGVQNCRSSDVFAGTLSGTGVGSEIVVDGGTAPNLWLDPSCGNCAWNYRITNASLNAKPLVGASTLNAEIHRGEYIALFVRNNAAGIPSLNIRRLARNSVALAPAEELIEGVENMQLRFGYDTSNPPDGQIDEYRTSALVSGAAVGVALDDNWRRVLSVRVGLLMRSAERSGAAAATFDLLGETLTPPNDGAMRQIYETTIAVRNRLFNS